MVLCEGEERKKIRGDLVGELNLLVERKLLIKLMSYLRN